MRVYLDTNIYSSLKTDECKLLRSLIVDSKANHIYLFSEAHIYDLVRDESDEKLRDMSLIEEICGRNCYYFDKQIQYNFFSPREYYERFDWTPTVLNGQTDLLEPIALILKLVPMRISDYLKPEQIPTDCPVDFIDLLNKSTNLYEFLYGFMDFTESLTNEQIRFREFLKYLHSHSLTGKIYEQLGIQGFDGDKVVDQSAFKDSYMNYIYNTSTLKDIYSVFTLMYNSLEILGLVKGKPRKQRMTNLINDSRHSYFGSFCDIVVSRDEDFRNKCSFLYEALGLDTIVCDLKTFESIIKDAELFPSTYNDLTQAINQFDEGELRKLQGEDGREYYIKDLDKWYFGYFDSLSFTSEEKLNRMIFSKERKSFSLKAIQPELEYLTNQLSTQLGVDFDNKSEWNPAELKDGQWSGRQWIKDGLIVELMYHDKLFIRISGLAKT